MTSQPGLYQKLRDSICKDHENRIFIPMDALKGNVTNKSIKATLDKNLKLPGRLGSIGRLADKVEKNDARRLFVVLLFIKEPRSIKNLLDAGFTDLHLPLAKRGDKILESVHDPTKRFEIPKNWDPQTVDDFVVKQWMLLAPFFKATDRHVDLDSNCPFPFSCPDASDGAMIYPNLYKARIEQSHQEGFETELPSLLIAIKSFRERDKSVFEQERDNLNIFRGLERNKHITQHWFTISQGKMDYIIFPWAEGGDLTNFWVEKSPETRTPQLVLWCLKQMLGVVEALNALHHQLGDNLELGNPNDDPSRRQWDPNCRHGDLKPGNILHFLAGEEERGVLKIADFGISRFHFDGTFNRSATNTRATTPAYEAPEGSPSMPKGSRSRKYDIWSLGCIFLEFTIWIVRRWGEVQSFENSRKVGANKQGADAHAHFYQITQGEMPVAHVHQEVTRKITDLKDIGQITEGTALGDLLVIIESKLLRVAVDDRYDAGGLYKQLETIVQRATSERVYLSSNMNLTPS